MRPFLLPFLALLFASAVSSATAQSLSQCAAYSPETLDARMQSRDLQVAAYAHTCRMINVDAYVSQQTSAGFSASDSHYWIETYQNIQDGIERALAVNRRWAGTEASRNLNALNRLADKYRRLVAETEPGDATGSYARPQDDSPADRRGRFMQCQSQIGVGCQAQCAADQTCYYRCIGGNAWRCDD